MHFFKVSDRTNSVVGSNFDEKVAQCSVQLNIQQLNDAFRTSLSAHLGRVVMTSGVACLDAETIAQILNAVRTYEQFDKDIDPQGEHDMGRFTINGEDYY